MFRAIDIETGDIVYLDRAIIETDCPKCGKTHEVDLEEMVQLMQDLGSSWNDMRVHCEKCSAVTEL